MNKKTIILTGATGFLGSYLLEALIKIGYNLIVLKRSTSNLYRINHLHGLYKSYDIDVQSIHTAFEENQIDFLIHTACHYGRNGDPVNIIVDANIMFGLRLLDACIRYKVKTFINTDTLLSRDINDYSLSKKQFLEWLQKASEKIQIVNLRLEHMYGPKDDTNKFVPWIVSQLKQNVAEVKLTKGEQLRDFIFIDDVVSAYLTVLDNLFVLPSFNEFDVGTGVLVTVKYFLEQLKYIYENTFSLTNTHLDFGAIPYRMHEMMSVEVDNLGLINLGWMPKTTLEQGLKRII